MSKVNVLTVEDAKIKRWRWWSNWVDVAVIDYAGDSYLVQMKISRTNAKAFRCRKTTGRFTVVGVSSSAIGDLTQMGWNPR